MKPEVQLPAKKSYKPPHLIVYGNIRELTQTLNINVGTDNIIMMNRATH